MEDKILRKLFLGFMHIHILHHARQKPFYGLWMIEELQEHGYLISAGTLYPMLRDMEQGGLLDVDSVIVGGKVRKYYAITAKGEKVLLQASEKCRELFKEISR